MSNTWDQLDSKAFLKGCDTVPEDTSKKYSILQIYMYIPIYMYVYMYM